MSLAVSPRCIALFLLFCVANAADAVDFVSVRDASAILYDAPSTKAKKLFVVNRYMPFEQVVTLNSWVKVRDRSGKLYWIEKRELSSDRYVFALLPLVDVRAEPSVSSPKVYQVRQQVVLQLIESTGTGWIRVRHQDGNVGYVRKTDVWGD
jgi:SH3-like domain-containing protein